MDWKNEVVNDLKMHGIYKQAVRSLQEKIAILELDYGRLRAVQSDTNPVQGGGSSMEDALISNIVLRDKLRDNLEATRRRVQLMEEALESLEREERLVLDYWYIDRPPDRYLDVICDQLSVEKTTAYRIRDRALYKLNARLYGVGGQ